ncbi:MAG: hypothetical protein ABIJ37_09185 [Pseudomonadota bacterium]
MKKISCTNFIRCLLLFGVILYLTGCSATTPKQANHNSKAKEIPKSLSYKTEAPAIPPIDKAAPTNFETASFGLG